MKREISKRGITWQSRARKRPGILTYEYGILSFYIWLINSEEKHVKISPSENSMVW